MGFFKLLFSYEFIKEICVFVVVLIVEFRYGKKVIR